MTINQLFYFVAIVEHHTFMEAADVLHLSQSSLSKSIKRLEEELGVALFNRSGRSAILTAAGNTFYDDACNILSAYDDAMNHLCQISPTINNTIHLISLPILSAYHLTGLLHQFASQHKQVQLLITEAEDNATRQALDEGSCDVAITRMECLPSNAYTCYPLAVDELVLITAINHPLAQAEAVSLKKLSAEAFIMMHKHISIHDLAVKACQKNGFVPHIIRTARIESIVSAVAAGEGISLLMRRNLDMFNTKDIAILPLDEAVTSTVVLAISKYRKPDKSVTSLIQFLTDSLYPIKK